MQFAMYPPRPLYLSPQAQIAPQVAPAAPVATSAPGLDVLKMFCGYRDAPPQMNLIKRKSRLKRGLAKVKTISAAQEAADAVVTSTRSRFAACSGCKDPAHHGSSPLRELEDPTEGCAGDVQQDLLSFCSEGRALC